MDRIEIPLSKKKILILLIAGILFVIAGIFFIITPETFVLIKNPEKVRLVGMVSVIFFGACLIYCFRKLFDKKMGLIIDQYGITDNTNGTSVGLIEWKDITKIATWEFKSTKLLLIFISNPHKYIDRANGLKKILMKTNMKMCGTPLSITSNSLRCNFSDLEKLIKSRFSNHL